MRTRFQRQDIFGADVVGRHSLGVIYAQVTTGGSSAVSARKKKLKTINWFHEFEEVLMLQVLTKKVGRKNVSEFRIWELDPVQGWLEWDELVAIPSEWKKPFRKVG